MLILLQHVQNSHADDVKSYQQNFNFTDPKGNPPLSKKPRRTWTPESIYVKISNRFKDNVEPE